MRGDYGANLVRITPLAEGGAVLVGGEILNQFDVCRIAQDRAGGDRSEDLGRSDASRGHSASGQFFTVPILHD